MGGIRILRECHAMGRGKGRREGGGGGGAAPCAPPGRPRTRAPAARYPPHPCALPAAGARRGRSGSAVDVERTRRRAGGELGASRDLSAPISAGGVSPSETPRRGRTELAVDECLHGNAAAPPRVSRALVAVEPVSLSLSGAPHTARSRREGRGGLGPPAAGVPLLAARPDLRPLRRHLRRMTAGRVS
jgi:hypothetical protein